MNRKNLLTRILLTVVAVSLMAGLSAAQEGARKPAPRLRSTMAASGDLLDIDSATKINSMRSPGIGAGSVLTEDYRRPSLPRQTDW